MNDTVNITLGPEQHINSTLDVLRGGSATGEIAPRSQISPGLFLDIDPKLKPSGTYCSPAGRLLEMDLQIGEPADSWVALHFGLGETDLTQAGFVGFACRSAAKQRGILRACLRSDDGAGGFSDCFFDKSMIAGPERLHHLDVLPLAQRGGIPAYATWRELIFFLPQNSFFWALEDLRLFII